MSETELIPYTVTLEGKIEADRLPELITTLGKFSAELTVTSSVGETDEFITRKEFRDAWNPQGAGRAWRFLIYNTLKDEKFPLRFDEGSPQNQDLLLGSPAAALTYIEEHRLSGQGSGVVRSILEKIIEQRQADT